LIIDILKHYHTYIIYKPHKSIRNMAVITARGGHIIVQKNVFVCLQNFCLW